MCQTGAGVCTPLVPTPLTLQLAESTRKLRMCYFNPEHCMDAGGLGTTAES